MPDNDMEALLQILALGARQIEEGKVQLAEDVFQKLRERQLQDSHYSNEA